MVNTRLQKEQRPLPDASQTIPNMIGGRIRKRRALSSSTLPSKRVKTTHVGTLPPKAQVASYVTEPTSCPTSDLSAVKPAPTATLSKLSNVSSRPVKTQRQLRLSEMLKRDRQQKLERSAPPPAIIIAPGHIDSRHRPLQRSLTDSSSFASDSSAKKSVPSTPKRPREKASNDSQIMSLLSSPVTRHPPTPTPSVPLTPVDRTKSERIVDSFVTASTLASTRVRASGNEAIAYSPTLLPAAHTLLLSIFSGIETAVNLLRTRQEFPSFGAVRSIVAKSSKRDFTFRHLSQLAHIVPEALSVLPPRNSRLTGRIHLLLRLDDVGEKLSDKANAASTTSKVGGAATRARRRLLHERLLEHVRQHHKLFLKKRGIKSFESNFWHQDFDLETDVPQLGAPPLYPSPAPKAKEKPSKQKALLKASQEPENVRIQEKPMAVVDDTDSSKKAQVEDKKEDLESCIPAGLLERVRARTQARNELVKAKEVDFRTKPEYLAKLPATMDTIAAILRADKRQAFGWSSLIMRLVKQHPKKWDAKEIERQMNSVVEHASKWCTKVTLSGAKLRYAFRLVDERTFASERAKVIDLAKNL